MDGDANAGIGGNMKLLIKSSKVMDKQSKFLGSMESRFIRVPAELRDEKGLEEGEFINLRGKEKVITLIVSPAYKIDAYADPIAAYVSKEVFDMLHFEKVDAACHNIEIVDNITLGCDPEFFLIDSKTRKTIHAYRLFRKFGQVGHDGVQMELRPLPSTNELTVANNIYGLIRKARKQVDESGKVDGKYVKMVAMSYFNGLTAGFHLHFGLPYKILGFNRFVKNQFQKQIVRALDYYVGVPSVIPEGEGDHERRSSPKIIYGKPGEMRIDKKTLEYRVPGGSLMRHPILTIGILGLGAIVIEDAVSRFKACTNSFDNLSNVTSSQHLKDIYPHTPDVFDMFKIICSQDLTLAKKHMEIIKKDIKQMVGYEKRKDSIEQFLRCIEHGIYFSPYMEENWSKFYEDVTKQNEGGVRHAGQSQ